MSGDARRGAATGERYVAVGDGYRLWADAHGADDQTPLLLVMGANSSGVVWPDDFVARLAAHHRVVRYDHRDTGASTWAFTDRPYPLRALADDAIAVLDAFEIERAHVVGMSLGGLLVQLLLLDHAPRLRSAAMFCTTALTDPSPGGLDRDLPPPDPRLLEMWRHMGEARALDEELDWRVQHWRLLNGDQLAFEPDVFREMEQRVIEHSERADSPTAHAQADQDGLERGAELIDVTTPTLVIEAPADPINPPPHARHLAASIPGAELISIPGMGHALSAPVIDPLASAIVAHTTRADGHPETPQI